MMILLFHHLLKVLFFTMTNHNLFYDIKFYPFVKSFSSITILWKKAHTQNNHTTNFFSFAALHWLKYKSNDNRWMTMLIESSIHFIAVTYSVIFFPLRPSCGLPLPNLIVSVLKCPWIILPQNEMGYHLQPHKTQHCNISSWTAWLYIYMSR